MADVAIFKINYKSDFVLTINSDAGWAIPFCIKFWTASPSQAYFVGFDGTNYKNCRAGETASELVVLFDDHHLPIGNLKMQIAYHATIEEFPKAIVDEVTNATPVITDIDGMEHRVMLDFTGETSPELEFDLPAYANEAQRIANEQQRIANEEQRIANEEQRIQNEQQRIRQEQERMQEFNQIKHDLDGAADDANYAATLANEKAALAQQKAEYAKAQGDYAKEQGNYAKEQGDVALADHLRAEEDHGIAVDDHTQAGTDHTRAESDHGIAVDDHTQAGTDHTRAESDHGIAVDDHTQAGSDHTRAESDHGIAVDDHTQAGTDHQTAQSDHTIAANDHTQAGNDHTRAESDHGIAVDDHTQAGTDHQTAQSDHTIAGNDHTQAGSDHTRAESDHTRAEADHAAVEVYVDSLGAFDISAYHATGGVLAKYADLAAALGTNGTNIPDAIRKGGMSVKYVNSSDSTYVSYILTTQIWSIIPSDWQKLNLENEVEKLYQDTYVDITKESTRVNGYFIPETGVVTQNGLGYYLENIQVNSGDKCYIKIKSTLPDLANTRIHGYSGDTWVEQIALIVKEDGKYYAEEWVTIPNGIDNIRISAVVALYSIEVYDTNKKNIDKVDEQINDIDNSINGIVTASYVDITKESTRVNGYLINESGVVTQNGLGYYLENIQVNSGDKCYIKITATDTSSQNTRIHGYSGDTWVEQIALIVKEDGKYYAEEWVTIPNGIDNIRISAANTISLQVYDTNKKNIDKVDEQINGIVTASYVDITKESTRVNGYLINESGEITQNSRGYYLENIQVNSSDKCYVKIKSTSQIIANTRIHGYNGDTWVEQIALIVKEDGGYYAGAWVTIPDGIDNIKISTSNIISLEVYNTSKKNIDKVETQIQEVNERIDNINLEQSTYINMGVPCSYLSETIEDEILDSKTCDDVYAIYDSLCSNYPQYIQRLSDIGYDESGLPIRLYRVCWQEPWLVTSEASWNPQSNIYNHSVYDYQKIWISSGTHGNEKASVYGVALAIKEIVESSDDFAKYLRGNAIIDICPIVNPWGFNNTSRNGYHVAGLEDNINRDFLTRTRSESQAVYNRVTTINYDSYIDSHNSGGNANYYGITNTNPLLKTYVQMNMKLGGFVYDSWDILAQDEQYAVKPYLQCWSNASLGMMQDMMNELGIPGHLIESVGVFAQNLGTLTPNHKKFCKFTKDLLVNSMIALITYKFPHITPNT